MLFECSPPSAAKETCCNLPSLSTWPKIMVVGLYRMLKHIHYDGSYARDSQLLTMMVVDMACAIIKLPAALLLDEILADLAYELRY